jgi:hypothetical protein
MSKSIQQKVMAECIDADWLEVSVRKCAKEKQRRDTDIEERSK